MEVERNARIKGLPPEYSEDTTTPLLYRFFNQAF